MKWGPSDRSHRQFVRRGQDGLARPHYPGQVPYDVAMAIRLGYDTYTIRALKWNAFQHLDYVQQQKLDAVQFSSLDSFASLEPVYLARVKGRAEELGVRIDAGIGCVCE